MEQPYHSVTLYLRGMFGYEPIEAKDVRHRLGPYAQFDQAVIVEFVRRGKRKLESAVETSRPSLVILQGWNHLRPKNWVSIESSLPGLEVKAARHAAFDSKWDAEFDDFLRHYLADRSVVMLADYRGHDTGRQQFQSPDAEKGGGLQFLQNQSQVGRERFVSAPDEIPDAITLFEGYTKEVLLNAYERNPRARQQCIAHYGTNCHICNFNFGHIYGKVGNDLIFVHHLTPLSEIKKEYIVDPIRDLRPVCANCHSIIHRRTPPFSIDEVKGFLAERKQIVHPDTVPAREN